MLKNTAIPSKLHQIVARVSERENTTRWNSSQRTLVQLKELRNQRRTVTSNDDYGTVLTSAGKLTALVLDTYYEERHQSRENNYIEEAGDAAKTFYNTCYL
jgi:hypothetical protein